MPVTYTFEGDLLSLVLVGIYEIKDVTDAFDRALQDPACPENIRFLVDVTRSESLQNRPTEQIRYVAEYLGPYRDRIGGRCAVIAASDVHYGMGRMGAVFAEGVGVEARIFRTREDAVDWLTRDSGS